MTARMRHGTVTAVDTAAHACTVTLDGVEVPARYTRENLPAVDDVVTLVQDGRRLVVVGVAPAPTGPWIVWVDRAAGPDGVFSQVLDVQVDDVIVVVPSSTWPYLWEGQWIVSRGNPPLYNNAFGATRNGQLTGDATYDGTPPGTGYNASPLAWRRWQAGDMLPISALMWASLVGVASSTPAEFIAYCVRGATTLEFPSGATAITMPNPNRLWVATRGENGESGAFAPPGFTQLSQSTDPPSPGVRVKIAWSRTAGPWSWATALGPPIAVGGMWVYQPSGSLAWFD